MHKNPPISICLDETKLSRSVDVAITRFTRSIRRQFMVFHDLALLVLR